MGWTFIHIGWVNEQVLVIDVGSVMLYDHYSVILWTIS